MTNLRKFEVQVTQIIEVTLDADKFDEAFLSEFRESFYPFFSIEDHAEHIAQLQARGMIDIEIIPEFIEGYGPSDEMGLKTRIADHYNEVLP